jgi:hypothetical protein
VKRACFALVPHIPDSIFKQPAAFLLMVRSAAKLRVSNHEAPVLAAILRDASLRDAPQDEV